MYTLTPVLLALLVFGLMAGGLLFFMVTVVNAGDSGSGSVGVPLEGLPTTAPKVVAPAGANVQAVLEKQRAVDAVFNSVSDCWYANHFFRVTYANSLADLMSLSLKSVTQAEFAKARKEHSARVVTGMKELQQCTSPDARVYDIGAQKWMTLREWVDANRARV